MTQLPNAGQRFPTGVIATSPRVTAGATNPSLFGGQRKRQIENFGFLSGGGMSNFEQPSQTGDINSLIQAFFAAGLPIPFAGTTGIPSVNFTQRGVTPSLTGASRPAQTGGANTPPPPQAPTPQVGGPATTQAFANLNSPPPSTGNRVP